MRGLNVRGAIRSFPAYCALAVLVFLAHALLILLAQDASIRVMITDITFPVINLSATAALFLAGRSYRRLARKGQEQTANWVAAAWMILGVGQLCYTLGDAIWGVLEVGLHFDPFPSLADAGYLAYYPFFLIGILHLPVRTLTTGERVKRGLDIAVVLLGAALGFWRFLISPIIMAGSGDSPLALSLSLAYPAGDFLLFFALLVLLYQRPVEKSTVSFGLLALSLIVTIISDCLFTWANLSGGVISGGWLDLGFLAGYLLVGLAALWQILLPVEEKIAFAKYTQERPGQQASRTEQMLLPIVMAFFSFTLLLDSYTVPVVGGFPLMAAGVAFVILLVFLRQVAAINENNRLLGELNQAMDTVRQQAETMEVTNRELEQEITERVRVEEQLLYEALHDPLTDLPNRTMFLNRLEQSLARARENPNYHFSVLFLDFDQFKMVNDSLGHSTGDQLLVEIANRLRHALFTSDVIARLGGDEFVILLEDTPDEESVVAPLAKIQDALREPYTLKGRQLFISVSIGVVASARSYRYSGDILRDADIAMYRAKAMGKNRYEIFNDHLRADVVSRLALESELRSALTREEFVLYYQPIYNLRGAGAPVLEGFETLVRWKHPARGLLAPDAFIAAAEETGLIVSIDRWVLRSACAQLEFWRGQFPGLGRLAMNVNISGKQFAQPDWIPHVEECLRRYSIPPEKIGLEITERLLVEKQKDVTDAFRRLRALGVQLQIDDFGTGYSSLSYLQRFPIQTIKVDRSFVNEISPGSRGADLVHTILLMARRLGMNTVAEGIETAEQLDMLKDMGCDFGQGYLLARPMDANAASHLLAELGAVEPAAPVEGSVS